MFLLAASYDLTDYPAVRTVCIILSLILAGIVLAIAITNYIREGKAIRSENVRCGCAEDSESVSETLTEKEEASAEECETAISAEQTAEETVEPIEESLTKVAAESVEDAVCEEAEPVAEVPAPEADTESFAEEPVTEVAAEEKAESVAEPVAESAEVENEETARLDEVAAAAVEAPTVGEEQAPTESEVTTDYDALPVFFEKLTRNLSEEDKDAFAGLIVGENRVEKTKLKYPLTSYADEAAFLKDFFLSAGKFKSVIPMSVMETLYKKRGNQVKTDSEKTRLNNKLIAFYFARRKTDEGALEKCEKLCKKDVAFNYENRDVRGMKLPALKRLILIYTAQKRYEDAIRLCDEAITREVIEKKDEGYEERRSRIVGKMNRAAEIAAAKAAKAEAKAAKAKATEE